MPKPQPRMNQIHQKILGDLIATKPSSWTKKTIDPDSPNPAKPNVLETKVAGTELKHSLAANVSEQNIDRAAARWTP